MNPLNIFWQRMGIVKGVVFFVNCSADGVLFEPSQMVHGKRMSNLPSSAANASPRP
jgi:hypothetical protein